MRAGAARCVVPAFMRVDLRIPLWANRVQTAPSGMMKAQLKTAPGGGGTPMNPEAYPSTGTSRKGVA